MITPKSVNFQRDCKGKSILYKIKIFFKTFKIFFYVKLILCPQITIIFASCNGMRFTAKTKRKMAC